MFQRVDGLVGVQTRKARLTLSLSLSINCRKSQEVILVTESPNSPYVQKCPLWSNLNPKEKEDTHGDDSCTNIWDEDGSERLRPGPKSSQVNSECHETTKYMASPCITESLSQTAEHSQPCQRGQKHANEQPAGDHLVRLWPTYLFWVFFFNIYICGQLQN